MMTATLSQNRLPAGDGLATKAAPASWLRPGVVVHDPCERVDGLLAQFALILRSRGFAVEGYVQCPPPQDETPAQIDYLDLATSRTFTVERTAAARYLQKAVQAQADLVVLGRFAACVDATDSAGMKIGSGQAGGIPLLTSIAGGCIHKWHSYARHEGSMLAPDLGSLWAWWGPERLYQDLAQGVTDEDVVQIACGPRWIMVQGERGTGLAYLPKSPKELMPRLNALRSWGLRRLAGLVHSWDPLETALGIAAINAFYNRHDLEGQASNGVRAFRDVPGQKVVVGAFPGVSGILPDCQIIEMDPRPGEYPLTAMDSLLPGCGGAIVSSSSLVNRSLPRILRLTRGRPVGMVGPATPLTPRLHDHGVSLLGGLRVHDPRGLGQAVRAGALPREFGQFGSFIHIKDRAAAAV